MLIHLWIWRRISQKLTSQKISLVDGQVTSQGVLLESGHVLGGLLTSFDIDPTEFFTVKPFTAPFT